MPVIFKMSNIQDKMVDGVDGTRDVTVGEQLAESNHNVEHLQILHYLPIHGLMIVESQISPLESLYSAYLPPIASKGVAAVLPFAGSIHCGIEDNTNNSGPINTPENMDVDALRQLEQDRDMNKQTDTNQQQQQLVPYQEDNKTVT